MADTATAPDPWAAFRAGDAPDAQSLPPTPQVSDAMAAPDAADSSRAALRPSPVTANAPPEPANDGSFQLPQEGDPGAGMVITVRPPARSSDKTGDSQTPGPTSDKADPWAAFRVAAAAQPANDIQHAAHSSYLISCRHRWVSGFSARPK